MSFIYKGKTYKNCGPSGAQQSALASDTAFGAEVRNSYNEDFSEAQDLFDELHSNLSTIVSAGPSQQGFSAPELAADNAQAVNSAAASAKDVAATIGEKAGVKNNADPGVESGVEEAVQAGAATKIANSLANTEENITQTNYKQGNANFENAVAQEEGLPSAVIDPVTGTAKVAIGADETTDSQANQNAAAQNSWMGIVGGITGGVARGLMSGLSGSPAPATPNTTLPAGFDPEAGNYLNED